MCTYVLFVSFKKYDFHIGTRISYKACFTLKMLRKQPDLFENLRIYVDSICGAVTD